MRHLFHKCRGQLLTAPSLENSWLRLRAFHADFLLSALSRLIARPMRLAPGSVMVVAPHYDDETLGCGGLIALKRLGRDEVVIVFLTNGGASPLPADGTLSREELSCVRKSEARAAAVALGVPESELHFMECPDGAMRQLGPEESEGVIRKLSGLMLQHELAQVFVTHGSDGHGDHEAAFDLTLEAVRRTARSIEILQYLIWKPWLHPIFRSGFFGDLRRACRLAIGPVLGAKVAAIEAHASQLATLPPGFVRRFHRSFELFIPALVNKRKV